MFALGVREERIRGVVVQVRDLPQAHRVQRLPGVSALGFKDIRTPPHLWQTARPPSSATTVCASHEALLPALSRSLSFGFYSAFRLEAECKLIHRTGGARSEICPRLTESNASLVFRAVNLSATKL